MARRQGIQCHICAAWFGSPLALRKDIQAAAKREGWSVSVPIWAVDLELALERQSAGPLVFYAHHPELRNRTVDSCPECKRRQISEAMARVEDVAEFDQYDFPSTIQ